MSLITLTFIVTNNINFIDTDNINFNVIDNTYVQKLLIVQFEISCFYIYYIIFIK